MKYLKAFVLFWWDFIVGDDWLAAAGIVLTLAITAFFAHHGVNAWVLMPLGAVAVLYLTLRRATT